MITRTERGWPAHFICADQCLFRRNTLLEDGDQRVIISTVGNLYYNGEIQHMGASKWFYETYVWGVEKVISQGETYWDVDVSQELESSRHSTTDKQANDMHEAVVEAWEDAAGRWYGNNTKSVR